MHESITDNRKTLSIVNCLLIKVSVTNFLVKLFFQTVGNNQQSFKTFFTSYCLII